MHISFLLKKKIGNKGLKKIGTIEGKKFGHITYNWKTIAIVIEKEIVYTNIWYGRPLHGPNY